MNKVSLANKYRPQAFEEIVEQDAIKDVLRNQIKMNNLKHAYLFCGGAGTGKTTTCRIIAKEMNEGKGEPFEIDCASHNGVEDMKVIQEQCKTKSLTSKYKIFILDECFSKDTLVKTIDGDKPISTLNAGDMVYTSSGPKPIKSVNISKVINSRLCTVQLSDGSQIHTTVDHLFMTTEGWVEAKNLVNGDELIVYSELSKLWKTDTNTQKGEEILQQSVLSSVVIQESSKQSKSSCKEEMCNMWQTLCGERKITEYKDLFDTLQEQINIAIREDNNELRLWDGIKEVSIYKNENKQSNVRSLYNTQNDTYENIEWNTESTFQGKRWKWQIYNTSNDIIQQFRLFLGIGVSNLYTNKEKQQSSSLSYIIQSRPWLYKQKDSNRGGWQKPQYEIGYTERYKKANKIRRIRVECVTFYKRPDNEQLGSGSTDYTEMYDLTIKDDPTYFVNNMLVHNCHMLTVQAWNSMLKLIEEPPDYVIFMFATTDPQKIPSTITSRLQRFNFTRISVQGITDRLKYIIEEENKQHTPELQITYEDSAVVYIARICKGGMRDSITTLEKCIDYNRNLSLQNVLKVTSGGVSELTLLSLLQCILNKDVNSALTKFNDIYMSGTDVSLFLKLYVEFVENCVKFLLTKNDSIVTLTDVTINWLLENTTTLDSLKLHLQHTMNVKGFYSTDDLKILIESWLIAECS